MSIFSGLSNQARERSFLPLLALPFDPFVPEVMMFSLESGAFIALRPREGKRTNMLPKFSEPGNLVRTDERMSHERGTTTNTVRDDHRSRPRPDSAGTGDGAGTRPRPGACTGPRSPRRDQPQDGRETRETPRHPDAQGGVRRIWRGR